MLINPSLASPLTKLTIQGGEECLVHGLLTMTMSASAAIPTPNSRGSSSSMASASQNDQSGLNEIDFAKLRDGRGWIAIKSSSGELLFKSLRKRGDSQTLQSQSSNEIRGVQGNSMYRKKVSL